MSYNGSGTYVPPAGQPVATGTVIQSATFNTLVTDIGNTFNNVLPRDGQAPMQGQLKITDGTSAIPGIGFNSEASSGMYRPVGGALALVASGVENLRINSAGRLLVGTTTDDGTNKLQVNGPTKITGAVNVTGALTANSTIAATGAITSSSTISAIGGIVGASYTGSNLVLQSSVPFIYFDENDQTGASGYWRMVADANGWRFDKNTSASRDWATYVSPIIVGSTGSCSINGAVPVQQGTAIGTGANTIKLGWGTTGGGLKCTVDSTDQGYLVFSSTNANAGNGITLGSPTTVSGLLTAAASANVTGVLTCSNGLGNALTVNGSAQINYGMNVAGQPSIFTGGAAATLTNSGLAQFGNLSGLSIAISDQIIQSRNNGAVNNLYLNYNGGQVSTGGLTANNSNFLCNGTVSATNGLNITGSATLINGGSVLSLANNGFMQVGSSGGLNIVADYANIQARSNGAVSTLNLNPNGGTVRAYGALWGATVTSLDTAQFRGTTDWKIQFTNAAGSSAQGILTTSATSCFGVINGANTLQTLICDNSGNFTAAGNVTAYSDETLKTNWRDIESGFVERWADIKHGMYDRIDTGETQVGLSAQSVQAVLPNAVSEQENGKLALNYGASAAIASVQLAKELVQAKALIKRLMEKVGLV